MIEETIWTATDEDGDKFNIDRITDNDNDVYYQMYAVEGCWSGYPAINLTREDILKLFYSAGIEVGMLSEKEIRVLHIMKEKEK